VGVEGPKPPEFISVFGKDQRPQGGQQFSKEAS
jgi:hypothetical protein